MKMEEVKESKELLDECWEMIYNHLDHASYRESFTLVSKRFLSITNSLKLSLKISGNTPIPILCRLLQRFSNLKKIQFCEFEGDLNEAVVAIARSGLDLEELSALSQHRSQRASRADWLEELGSNMKNLKVLKFAGGQGDADVVRVADSFPQLEELYIEEEKPFVTSVTDEGMDYMTSKLKRLRKADLSNKIRISDKSLVSLSKNCPLLEHVEIHYLNSVTQEGISFLVNNSHNLNFLYIGIHLKIDPFWVNGATNFLTKLKTLRLENADISDEFLISIIEARIHLTDLELTNCKFTITGFSRLLQHTSQSLKSLKLKRVDFLTNEHIEYLSCFLQNLTAIKICKCFNLSDSAFVSITQRCPRLCHFVMTSSRLGKQEYYKYDGLMKKNRAIKYLDLSSHRDFSPTALKKLLNICPEVEKLNLSHCHFLHDDELNVPDVLECSRSLLELELRGSHYITAKDTELELDSSVLEKLILDSSTINDIFLTNLASICPRLIHLDLEYCSDVTEEGVKEVIKSCKRLIYLTISCCKNVDVNIIPWIVTSRPSLRKLVSSSRDYPDDENQNLFLQQGCLVLKDPNYNLEEVGFFW